MPQSGCAAEPEGQEPKGCATTVRHVVPMYTSWYTMACWSDCRVGLMPPNHQILAYRGSVAQVQPAQRQHRADLCTSGRCVMRNPTRHSEAGPASRARPAVPCPVCPNPSRGTFCTSLPAAAVSHQRPLKRTAQHAIASYADTACFAHYPPPVPKQPRVQPCTAASCANAPAPAPHPHPLTHPCPTSPPNASRLRTSAGCPAAPASPRPARHRRRPRRRRPLLVPPRALLGASPGRERRARARTRAARNKGRRVGGLACCRMCWRGAASGAPIRTCNPSTLAPYLGHVPNADLVQHLAY